MPKNKFRFFHKFFGPGEDFGRWIRRRCVYGINFLEFVGFFSEGK